MTALNIQAVQNDTDGACMVQEESCMTKEEILSGFDNALHELKYYREGKLELKPLEEVLNELQDIFKQIVMEPKLGDMMKVNPSLTDKKGVNYEGKEIKSIHSSYRGV